jgi:2-aminomuconate deaminase
MKNFLSKKAPKPVGFYPHAKKVGDLLFLSGVGPRVLGSKKIPGVILDDRGGVLDYDIEKQALSTFNNIKLILEECGSCWENIVDVTVFLTNMSEDFKKFNSLYEKHFSDCFPCRTTIEVLSLPTPIAIELKVIATI